MISLNGLILQISLMLLLLISRLLCSSRRRVVNYEVALRGRRLELGVLRQWCQLPIRIHYIDNALILLLVK